MNRDLAMENKKNGNISAAYELFRVSRVYVFSYDWIFNLCVQYWLDEFEFFFFESLDNASI